VAALRLIHGDQVADRTRILSESQAGWDGKDAKVMNLKSLANFVKISQIFNIAPKDTGVFLDYDGHITIQWCGADGDMIDASIGEITVEICTDEFDLELAIDDPALVGALNRL
jgi:hypothetical protein